MSNLNHIDGEELQKITNRSCLQATAKNIPVCGYWVGRIHCRAKCRSEV